jgi:hypothetical protein
MTPPSRLSAPALSAAHGWLGTGAAARMTHLSRNTIIKCIDTGLLPGRRTASGYRRVRRCDVLRFMKEHGIPLE